MASFLIEDNSAPPEFYVLTIETSPTSVQLLSLYYTPSNIITIYQFRGVFDPSAGTTLYFIGGVASGVDFDNGVSEVFSYETAFVLGVFSDEISYLDMEVVGGYESLVSDIIISVGMEPGITDFDTNNKWVAPFVYLN